MSSASGNTQGIKGGREKAPAIIVPIIFAPILPFLVVFLINMPLLRYCQTLCNKLYTCTVSELVSCAERLKAASEALDRDSFTAEATVLEGYITSMKERETEFAGAMDTY